MHLQIVRWLNLQASLAQLVEQRICNAWVIGSNPIGGSKANVAQLVEHNLAKVRVVSSNLIIRSIHNSVGN